MTSRPALRCCRTFSAGRGHTLLELLAVLVVLGALAAVAAGSLRPDLLGNFRSRSDASRLAADLIRVRRMAIASNRNHLVLFERDRRGNLVGYTVHRRRADGTPEPVEARHDFPRDVTVTVQPPGSDPEFIPQGEALAGYVIRFQAPTRAWETTVYQATGAVRVAER
jgi:prepilin-type N-terminal cleavage/methylation domain-containing protein